MNSSLLVNTALVILSLSILYYQFTKKVEYSKDIPLKNSEKCFVIPGILGPSDIVNWKGIALTGSGNRSEHGFQSINCANGDIYAIYPSKTKETKKLTYKKISLKNFPERNPFHPNGLYLYNDYLYVMNNAYGLGAEIIEVFKLIPEDSDEKLSILYKYSMTMKDDNFGIINDIVVINEHEFLATFMVTDYLAKVKNSYLSTLFEFWDLAFKEIFSLRKSFVHYCKMDKNKQISCIKIEKTISKMNDKLGFDGKDLLLVSKGIELKLALYRLISKENGKDLVFIRDIETQFLTGYITFDIERNSFFLSAKGRLFDHLIEEYEMNSKGKVAPSEAQKSGILELMKQRDYKTMKIKVLYMQNELVGVSVGARFRGYYLMGSLYDDGLGVCIF